MIGRSDADFGHLGLSSWSVRSWFPCVDCSKHLLASQVGDSTGWETAATMYCYAGTSVDAGADRYCQRLTGPVHENIISVNIHNYNACASHTPYVHKVHIPYTYRAMHDTTKAAQFF